jgi:HPt (histidine-containing phosphotransfer) domain-containing protein
MDGVEATRGIRNLSGAWFKSMPIVALSANAVSGARETFLAAGMNDFISKPIMAEDLNAMLHKWLPPDKIIFAVEEVKVHPYSDLSQVEGTGAGDRSASLLRELAEVEGLDTKVGLSHVGDNILAYIGILRQFCVEFDGYIEEIRRYLATEDWKNYSIKLHAMKGVLATIGMDTLSKWAYKLELASKGEGIETCKQETEAICEAMYGFKEKLRSTGLMDKGEPVEKTLVEGALLKERLEAMKDACQKGDSDRGDVIAEELARMSFNEETDKAIGEICLLAESLDYEEVIQKIEELQAALP